MKEIIFKFPKRTKEQRMNQVLNCCLKWHFKRLSGNKAMGHIFSLLYDECKERQTRKPNECICGKHLEKRKFCSTSCQWLYYKITRDKEGTLGILK